MQEIKFSSPSQTQNSCCIKSPTQCKGPLSNVHRNIVRRLIWPMPSSIRQPKKYLPIHLPWDVAVSQKRQPCHFIKNRVQNSKSSHRVELAIHKEGDHTEIVGINPKLSETIAEHCLQGNCIDGSFQRPELQTRSNIPQFAFRFRRCG